MLQTSPTSPRARALRAAGWALPAAGVSLLATPTGSLLLGVVPLFALLPALALSDLPATRARPGRSAGALALALVADFVGLAFALIATGTVFLMLLALLPILLRPLWLWGAARLLTPLRSDGLAVLGLAALSWPTTYLAWTSGMAAAVQGTEGALSGISPPPVNPELWLAVGVVASAAWLGALARPLETE